MNQITVFTTRRSFDSDARISRSVAKKALDFLDIDNVAFDIALVSQPRMRFLNRVFRKKDKATNVLSFCEPEEFRGVPSDKKYLGEIYISPAYIRFYKQDIKHMVVHGILHLLGFDHETKKEREEMERKEKELLAKLR